MRRNVYSELITLFFVAMLSVPLSLQAQRSPDVVPPSIADRVNIDSRAQVDFHAGVWPDTVYVNLQVNYQIGVFLTEAARARLGRNPEFQPPEFRGLIAYEINAPGRRGGRVVRGTSFEAHIFHRALFPVASGTIVVPAPQLTYSLRSSSSYFSRLSSQSVRAESAQLVVRPLPEAGRPSDFTGAVGRFRSRGRINDDTLRVGDPVVFTLRVEGIGNIKLLPRPLLEVPWASVVTASERLSIDTSGILVRGAKEFDWILTPARDGAVEMAPIRYSYFDPYLESYEVALSDTLAVSVAPGAVIDTEERENAALLPLRERIEPPGVQLRAAQLVALLPVQAWLFVLALFPVPAVLLMIWRRSSVVVERTPAAVDDLPMLAARARNLSTGFDAAADARTVRRALHRALASRLGVHIQQLTDRREVARLLRRRGATRATVSQMMQLLDKLDRAGFAMNSAVPAESHAKAAADIFATIEKETLEPGARSRGVRHVSATLLLSWQVANPESIAVAHRPVTDLELQKEFAAGNAAYADRRFVEAASRFGALAQRAPDAVDVLANWGTAAWAQGDTVGAVLGWHRAARRDPVAADIQERLQLLPPGARGGIAEVSLMSPALLFVLSGAMWMLGWLLLAVVYRYRRRSAAKYPRSAEQPFGTVHALAWLLIVGSLVGAGNGWWKLRERDPETLWVVTRPETMRSQRGIDHDAVGGVGTGDIVRRLDVDGEWMRVHHADGRTGWLPASRLVQLDPVRTASR